MKEIRRKEGLIFAVVCGWILYRFGVNAEGVRAVLLWAVLLTASCSDIRCYRIPDRVHAAGIMIFLISSFFLPSAVLRIRNGMFFALLLSGSMLLMSLLFERLTGKENLGGGDIKLFFMTGLYFTSVWELLFYITLSCMFGLLTAAFRRTERIPFAPSITAACMLMLLYGEALTDWYIGLFL